MPVNKCKCSAPVKAYFSTLHASCHKSKLPHLKTGHFLNSFCHIIQSDDQPQSQLTSHSNSQFDSKENYQICDNLMRILNRSSPMIPTATPTPRRSREERAENRDDLRRNICDDDNSASDSDLAADVPIKNPSDPFQNLSEPKTKKHKFIHRILVAASKFKKPFKNLLWRKRLERIDNICIDVIASCIDRKRASEEGVDYIVGNTEFAHEVLNIVNVMKERLELKLKVDLKAIEQPDPVPLQDEDEYNNNSLYFQNKCSIDFAVLIMGEATGRGFERIRKKYMLTHPEKQALPSLYKLNKSLPMDSVPIQVVIDAPESQSSERMKEEILLGIGDHATTQEDAFELFGSTPPFCTDIDLEDNQEALVGAKLDGNFGDYLDLMRNKLHSYKNTVSDTEDLIVISSFDGAIGIDGDKNCSNVVSFSSSLFTPRMINEKKIRAGESFNILTWMQVIGKENYELVSSSLKKSKYWEDRKDLMEGRMKLPGLENSKVFCYECHDGKMLYNMTQHSQWNRKNHPFLLCKCRREDGLSNSSHECEM